MLLITIQMTTFDTGMLPQPPYSSKKSLAWKPAVLRTEIANKQALNNWEWAKSYFSERKQRLTQ